MSQTYKLALDALVAQRLGLSRKRVSSITDALYDALLDQLVHQGTVVVPGLGTLRVYTSRVQRTVSLTYLAGKEGRRKQTQTQRFVDLQIRVCFSKSARLRAVLKETGYGEARR
jgi:nucleoid DNA-binding protein